MRCDVNISLRPAGSTTLGTRTEIKNVNSFRFVEKAIRHEIERQAEILETAAAWRRKPASTMPNRDETRPMRSKEVAQRLPLLSRARPAAGARSTTHFIAAMRAALPELPSAKGCALSLAVTA